jgi:hypothetical protein
MTEFTDSEGRDWTAFVHEEPGADYKGRFYLVMKASGDPDAEGFALRDVRWNTERTATRTLETMSVVELRRRRRAAVVRGASATMS